MVDNEIKFDKKSYLNRHSIEESQESLMKSLTKEQVRQLAIEHGLLPKPLRFELKNLNIGQCLNDKRWLIFKPEDDDLKYVLVGVKWNVTFEQVRD